MVNSRKQYLGAVVRSSVLLAGCLASSVATAQGLVAYYQIGGDNTPWVKWDTYVIDSSSLVAEDTYIRYKSFRVTVHGSDPPQEVKADCKTRKRGQVGDASMYSTYDGALTGEEVKAACSLAEAKGLVRK